MNFLLISQRIQILILEINVSFEGIAQYCEKIAFFSDKYSLLAEVTVFTWFSQFSWN